MICKIIDLAERYIRNPIYTIPLSLAATIEVKRASDLLNADPDHVDGNCAGTLSDNEKENMAQAADNFLCILGTRRKCEFDGE